MLSSLSLLRGSDCSGKGAEMTPDTVASKVDVYIVCVYIVRVCVFVCAYMHCLRLVTLV